MRLGGKRTPMDIEKARAFFVQFREFSRRLKAEMKTTEKRDELAELKRENKELRKTVVQLTKQLQQQEEKANERHQELLTKFMSPQSKPAETNKEPMDQTPGPSKRPAPEESDDDEEGFQAVKPKKRPAKRVADEGSRQTETTTVKATATQLSKPARIPPVVLRKQEKSGEIFKLLGQTNSKVTKAKLRHGAIEIEPATADDHRSLTKLLAERSEEYHTYTLPEKKPGRYVIKGIPIGIADEDIKEELARQGIQVQQVSRVTSRRTKEKIPLVLVKFPQEEEEKIRKITRCCSLLVRVEPQRPETRATQCYRCQRFGHSQGHCTAVFRCVRCGEEHPSTTCVKPREEPSKCANWGGPHPASYRGYSRAATQPKLTARRGQALEARRQAHASAARKTTSTSFADALKGSKQQEKTDNRSASLSTILANMQQIFVAINTLLAQMPATSKA